MTSKALACIVYGQLQGKWKLERTLKGTNTAEPSGKCYGIASFTPRPVTHISDHAAAEEMVYEEHGDFEISMPANTSYASPHLTFSRKYIWRLSSGQVPNISVWFTKPGTEDLDYLFHEQDLRFSDTSTKVLSAARAHGSHLCIDDMYETDYRYDMADRTDGEELTVLQWSTSHIVKGPKKDQLITTTFTKKDGSS